MMSSPTMDRNQRMIMLFMPLFFVFFVINFPAGVLVYWITTNTWTMSPAVRDQAPDRTGRARRGGQPAAPARRRPLPSRAARSGPADGLGGKRRRQPRGNGERRRRRVGRPERIDPRSRQVRRRRREPVATRPAGSAAQAAAQEEEALRTAQVALSVTTETPASALQDLLERIADTAGVEVAVEIARTTGRADRRVPGG